MNHELITANQLASLLEINLDQVYSLIVNQDLPTINILGCWFFHKPDIREWVLQNQERNLQNFNNTTTLKNLDSPLQNISLLLVEDSESDRELINRIIAKDSKYTYSIYETWSWNEALELYSVNHPDCILLDYSLPGFTGFELLRELQKTYPKESIAAIILTGGGNEDLAVEALRVGAKDYLPKRNINFDTLMTMLHRSIKKTRLERSLVNRYRLFEDVVKEATSVSESKNKLLANISHEIRTPLTNVLGFISLVLENTPNETHCEYLNLAKTSAEHILVVVNEILDFSKIEAGNLVLESQPLDLRKEIDKAIKICSPLAEIKSLGIVSQIDNDISGHFLSDATRILQIIVNLLGNTIKFAPSMGEITLKVKSSTKNQTSEELIFSVVDTSAGPSRESQEHISEYLNQSNNSISRFFGGTGLSLSIAAMLIELMGGKIWVDNMQEIGATFHFSLCLQPTTLPLNNNTEKPIADFDNTKPLHILVVEDNIVNQKLIKTLLQKANHQVSLASDGEEALEFLKHQTPDLIFMDIQMPKLDGLATTTKIREAELLNHSVHIPIVALTANAFPSDKEKCFEHGMDAYLSKPVNRQQLLDTLYQTINSVAEKFKTQSLE